VVPLDGQPKCAPLGSEVFEEQIVEHRVREGTELVGLLVRALLVVQGAPATVLGRSHSDQGVSTVQYALLEAVAALAVALLGSGAKDLFGGAHSCANGLTTTACRVGPHLQGVRKRRRAIRLH
jgi:hypothetical protein